MRILLTQRRSFVPVSMWRRRTLRGNVNVKLKTKRRLGWKDALSSMEKEKEEPTSRQKKKKKKKKRCEARKTEEEKQEDDTSGQTYTYSSFWNKHTKVWRTSMLKA